MLTRILVPTDGSASALVAARLSEALVAPRGLLTLMTVVPDASAAAAVFDSTVALLSGTVGNLRAKQAIETAQRGAQRLMATKEALQGHVPVRTEERRGSPTAVILDELATGRYDSVVLGSHGHGALTRALLGSVSEGVLRTADKPVLIARHPTVTSILVAVDGSPRSDEAVIAAMELSRRLALKVALIHVAQVDWEAPPEAQDAERANVKAHAEAFLARQAPALSGERIVAFGEPAREILNEAQARATDLIVLGSAGLTAHPRVVLGSVVARVAQHASASVLVVQ